MKIPVYDKADKVVGEMEVSDAIFNRPWNPDLLHQAIVTIAANRREPIAHTKQRDEVSGGGKTPWRQKGTGRARHGSTRSPLWKGGGATFGPRNDRDFSKKLPKKMAKAALYVALSKKLADGELRVIESLGVKEAKTRELRWLSASTLIIPAPAERATVFRASANLARVQAMEPRSLNAEAVVKFKRILIEKAAVEAIV